MNDHQAQETLVQRWGAGVLTTIPMFAAYVALGMALPQWMQTTGGFLIALSAATVGVSVVIGAIGRAMGWYTRNPASSAGTDARRQGNTAAQLALLLSWPIFSNAGIAQSFWIYLLAFFLLGAIGRFTFAIISGQASADTPNRVVNQQTTSFRREMPSARFVTPRREQIAPGWLRRLARICFAFGLLALARLLIDQEIVYAWVGGGLLAFALIVPSLVVALGGGEDSATQRRL